MYEYARIASPLLTRTVDGTVAFLRWSGFWGAIALPLVHVPLLVVEGATASSAPLLALLWVLNVLALVLGRHHAPDGRADRFAGGEDG
jgi:hypothetical protein